MTNIIKTSLLATGLALSIGSTIDTSASAHGFGGFGGFGGGHGPVVHPGGPFGGGHSGGWGGGYNWGGFYGHRWGRYGFGWGYGYPVSYSACPYGYHLNPWGTCVPTYYRPF